MLGYFLTLRAYGTWLHGHPEGSVDDDHNRLGDEVLPPNPARLRYELELLKHDPVNFGPEARWVIDHTVREVCDYRDWILTALNVRTTHLHVVVTAPEHSPERVMNDFKSYCTRWLFRSEVFPRETNIWSLHGSTRYLDTDESFNRAVAYTLHEQGLSLPMIKPSSWERCRKEPAR
jgi:REP element-mobilizing transposase RayT